MYTYAVMRRPAGRSYLASLHQPTIDNLNNATPHSPKRPRRKAHRAPHVHRVPQHIKREALHPMVHQDPKVVAEEGAGDAERPGRGDDEELAEGGEGGGDDEVERLGEERDARLIGEGAVVAE